MSNCDLANRKGPCKGTLLPQLEWGDVILKIAHGGPLTLTLTLTKVLPLWKGPVTLWLLLCTLLANRALINLLKLLRIFNLPNTDSDGESENTDDSEGEIKKIVYTD